MTKEMKVQAIGLIWFKNAAQYTEFMTIFEDAHVLPETYSKWLRRATELYESVLRQGVIAVKVQTSLDEFRTWCATNGHKLDADGRMAFGACKAADKLMKADAAQKDA